jgi:hypothetical protein
MPCEAVAGKPLYFLGGPFQHALAPAFADKFLNTTAVSNWNTVVGGLIGPYERFTQDLSGANSCESHSCNPDGAPCSAWLRPFPENSFAHTEGDKVNLAQTRKTGFKAVQARRLWHGALAWTSGDASCPDTFCNDHSYQSYQPDADQAKYRTATYDVHVRNSFNAGEDAGGYLNADKTGSRTVNPESGEITSDLITTQTAAQNYGGSIGVQIYFYTNGGAGYNADEGVTTLTFAKGGATVLDSLDNDLHCGFPRVRADAEGDLSGFISLWNSIAFGGGSEINPFVSTGLPPLTDPNNYSASSTGTLNAGNTTWTCDLQFSRSPTTASWDVTITQVDIPGAEDNTWHYYGTITLSGELSSATVYSDIKTLLAYWPLDDDLLYPWRADTKVSVAPLVSRLENSPATPLGFNTSTVDDLTAPINDADGNAPFSASWSPTYNQRPWFDPAIYIWAFPPGMNESNSAATSLLKIFDGSVQGAPLPAGY